MGAFYFKIEETLLTQHCWPKQLHTNNH